MIIPTIVLTVDQTRFKHGDFIRDRLDRCTASLNKFNMPYEVFYGPISDDENKIWAEHLNIPISPSNSRDHGCILSFSWAFDQIVQRGYPHMVLEFDAYLIKPIDFEIEEEHFYRLHPEPLGHGHIMTPTTAQLLLDHRRNQTLRWWKCYDDNMNMLDHIRIDKPGYVEGNEVMDEAFCARLRENWV